MESGILIVDKPKGITSFKAVSTIKRILGVKKVGHTGTLDPMATGLLAVCLGRATKIARFLTDTDKLYEGTITLGIETDTYDMEGSIVKESKVPFYTVEILSKVAEEFVGELYQSPPPFSAAKHKGVPLYKLARKGIKIDKRPKKIEVYEFKIHKYNPPVLYFSIHCSKGTYVRSIAHEFGKRLGCGACLSSLRRLRSGFLSLKHAIGFDELQRKDPSEIKQKILPVELVLSHIPGIVINNKDALAIQQGRGIMLSDVAEYMKEQLSGYKVLESSYLRLMARDKSDRLYLVCIAKWPDLTEKRGWLEILRVWNPN